MKSVIITDCGSTTTKGIWFVEEAGSWKMKTRAEAPTTVEKPVADVTKGVLSSLGALGKAVGEKVVEADSESPLLKGDSGSFDMYLSTSSAGGGLQMVVLGVVAKITGESAERAALGAGAIVSDKLSLDDGRLPFEQAQDIRQARPDIVLLTGGIDGGAIEQVRSLFEVLLLSEPRSRFDAEVKIPVLFAGNKMLQEEVTDVLGRTYNVLLVDNVRPSIEVENVTPAREAIHDLFLDHVMSQAPGYNKLQNLVDSEIVPTPAAVSQMIEVAATNLHQSIVAVDIGGATTDIFSIRRDEDSSFKEVHRTVSANLGMSYSVGNVLESAGIENVCRWIPGQVNKEEVTASIWNKMLRPTSIPETEFELYVEHAVAREALRLSFEHHQELDLDLQGISQQSDISRMFQTETQQSFNMFEIDMLIASGGVLSHAPHRGHTALMMIDSFHPLGATFLGVDSVFMMPHLGALSKLNEKAALELLFSECIIPVGTVITPRLREAKIKIGDPLFQVSIQGENIQVSLGELRMFDVAEGEEIEIEVIPSSSKVDFGSGWGKRKKFKIRGGTCGAIFDGRCGLVSRSDVDVPSLLNSWLSVMEKN